MTKYDVIVVGAGPAGIFTALEIVKLDPNKNVLILDKGRNIESRKCPLRTIQKCVHCKPCGIVNGWSGAGAFSDGKLSLSPEVGGRLTEYMTFSEAQELIKYVDKVYLDFGANGVIHGLDNKKVEDIMYESSKHNIKLVPCPVRHLGTDLGYEVLKNMYHYLKDQENFTFVELTEVSEVIFEGDTVKGVKAKNNKKEETTYLADKIVIAPGRGGAGWLEKLMKKANIKTENNEVDIGVRVEVPNSVMDHLTEHLYEPKLVYYSDTFENKVRSFCVNPGGFVSEEHYDDNLAVVNGHSFADSKQKSENTNFALLVSTKFTEPFDQPIEYGKYVAKLGNMITGGGILVQRLGDLINGRRTNAHRLSKSTTIPTLKSAVPGDLSFVLPQRYLTSIVETLKAFDKIAPGMYSKNTLLYGVEVKFYSSKVQVNNNFETDVKGLYTIGDGAGITRGLMQASVTGVIVARDICK
ncbi:NAD(P)/FAD-dependent oxidoreductase [Alkalicella caledoniensis]|uniref:NAD(P)/FAD-dependent oxidoreductase n=1 Tax=Alkalicella caledoniensis TaxID=2731377 RepID=A0A7G9W8M0_ALKCA|nr:NAD(P)/FAD-dependent oxidoreductase [Alkalicella caledoniensis]QNO15032.1 NAD(P)/FAD-dependent oxidoreductase [Alkalicella caledoniensis]